LRGAALATLLAASSLSAATRYPLSALILSIDIGHRTFVASCSEIPGYMKAMVMPFRVRDAKLLDGLTPSMFADFTLVVDRDQSWVENVREHPYESGEQEPMLVRRLQLLANLRNRNPLGPAIAIGAPVPDFTLTDQTGKRVELAGLRGKVVGITFIYTSCPLPDYCFRLSNNFGRIAKRFSARMGRDLVLLSVTFDPLHDTPEVLAKYAGIWKADAGSWHFLTGSLPEVKEVCHHFGLNFWPDEEAVTHSLHTIIVDRQGRLAANLEGNQFSAAQLSDFVEATLNRSSQAAPTPAFTRF